MKPGTFAIVRPVRVSGYDDFSHVADITAVDEAELLRKVEERMEGFTRTRAWIVPLDEGALTMLLAASVRRPA